METLASLLAIMTTVAGLLATGGVIVSSLRKIRRPERSVHPRIAEPAAVEPGAIYTQSIDNNGAQIGSQTYVTGTWSSDGRR